VPPEDGRLTPETCRELRHNKVFVKVKVYSVGYVIVIHNDTRSTKYQSYVEVTCVTRSITRRGAAQEYGSKYLLA
jgi:hypothetical protein